MDWIQCMFQRNTGQLQPIAAQRSIFTDLIRDLNLSQTKSVEQVFTAGVTAIDIGSTCKRYLLSGASNGSIAVHDILFLRKNGSNTSVPGVGIYKSVSSAISGLNPQAHKRNVRTVQWNPWNDDQFITSALDKSLKLWDARTMQVVKQISTGSAVHCHQMAFVNNSCYKLVAMGTDSCSTRLVDIANGKIVRKLRGHTRGRLTVLQWSNMSDHIIATGGADKNVILWDVRTGSALWKFKGVNGETAHEGQVHGLSFTENGHYLVSYGTDRKFYLWDSSTGKMIQKDYPNLCHVKKPAGRLALTVGASQSFVFIPAGVYILTFNVTSPNGVKRLYGHKARINCCLFHQEENQLFSGANDKNILVYTASGSYDDLQEDDG